MHSQHLPLGSQSTQRTYRNILANWITCFLYNTDGGEEVGAIGEGAEGLPEDLADDLNEDAAEIQNEVGSEVDDAIKVADEPPISDPPAQKLADDAAAEPKIKEALTPADGDVEALEPENTPAEEIEKTKQSAAEKFKSYATSAFKAFKGFFESDAGKLILEGVGTYFKFKMYVDLAQMGVGDIDNMIELIEGKDPHGQNKELNKIKAFITLISSLIKIAKKVDQSAANGAMFASENDPKKIAYQIKNFMFANAMEEFPDKAQGVTNTGTILIGQLGKAMRTLGFTGNMTTDQTSALLQKISTDNSTLSAAMALILPKSVTDFTSAINAYAAFTNAQVKAMPATAKDPNTGHTIQAEAEAFFRLPSGWTPLVDKIQALLGAPAPMTIRAMVTPTTWKAVQPAPLHVQHIVHATHVVINHNY